VQAIHILFIFFQSLKGESKSVESSPFHRTLFGTNRQAKQEVIR